MTKASAVDSTDNPNSASAESVDTESVHGCSTIRLAGISAAPPAIIDPAAGTMACIPEKRRPNTAAPA